MLVYVTDWFERAGGGGGVTCHTRATVKISTLRGSRGSRGHPLQVTTHCAQTANLLLLAMVSCWCSVLVWALQAITTCWCRRWV
jgi:hypothetical protein